MLDEKHEKIIVAVRKWEMLAATKVKMSSSGKKWTGIYKIFPLKICVTRKFLEVVVMQNNAKEMYKKVWLHVQSCFFFAN